MSRLLASIPLIIAHLPPIIIPPDLKWIHGNYEPLVEIFALGMISTMDKVEGMPPLTDDDLLRRSTDGYYHRMSDSQPNRGIGGLIIKL